MTAQRELLEYEKSLIELSKKSVLVGITKSNASEAVYGDGKTVGMVAEDHEFGTNIIPRRSFLRATSVIKSKEINKLFDAGFSDLLNGSSPDKILTIIGIGATNLVGEAFDTSGFGQWQGLSPTTLLAKAPKSKPLINTGVLKQSVSFELTDD